MPSADAAILPGSVRPAKYRIHLHPDLDEATFKGTEEIDVQVVEPTSTIVLNSVELEILGAELFRDGAPSIEPEISYDEKAETATLDFGQVIPTGPARLEIDYTGILNDKLRGFYLSKYTGSDGESR